MITMSLSEAALATGAQLLGADGSFQGCSTDSRSLKTDELFIALRGEHFDGHDFIQAVQKNGASAAMVDRNYDDHTDLSLLQVDDTRRAMGRLAEDWRSRFGIPLIAVTGSNGKTTVKEMLQAILSQQADVLATRGNLNNDIGVPLTLFGLCRQHRYAVIEMGANHVGEIAWLTRIAGPTVAVITQCAPAHLEGFGSVESVANAKAEIFEGLQQDGIAIINADDDYAELWNGKTAQYKRLSFGLRSDAHVVAGQIHIDPENNVTRFQLKTPVGTETISLPLPGEHNVMNALAATACCLAVDVPLSTIRTGLEGMNAVKGRLQLKKGINNIRIIDDTYNANPTSLAAATKVACSYPGACWLVLGDMAELGASSEDMHHSAGEAARESGIERLYAVGTLSNEAVAGFGKGARHFSTMEELINVLSGDLVQGITLLIKGSRSMAMERVVNALQVEER